MASALREVIALFDVAINDGPLKAFDRSVDMTKGKLRDFGRQIEDFASYGQYFTRVSAALGVAGFTAFKFVQAGSAANEQLNILNQTFKGGSEDMLKWAKTQADVMGRSEFFFREQAGRFGSFLAPGLVGDLGEDVGRKRAADMSKEMAKLAVDLASFYDMADEEATAILMSGLSGETESVRRLGVDIRDAALNQFAKKQAKQRGEIAKTTLQMTLREKTELVYQKILTDTADKQGDAQRTAGEWANTMRRLKSRFEEFLTRTGQRLLPTAKKWLAAFESISNTMLPFLEKAIGGVTALDSAILFLAGGAAVTGLAALVKMFMSMSAGAKMAAVDLAILFAIFDDLYAFFTGNKSLFGGIIQELTGVQQPLKYAQRRFEQFLTAVKGTWAELKATALEARAMTGENAKLISFALKPFSPVASNLAAMAQLSPEQAAKLREEAAASRAAAPKWKTDEEFDAEDLDGFEAAARGGVFRPDMAPPSMSPEQAQARFRELFRDELVSGRMGGNQMLASGIKSGSLTEAEGQFLAAGGSMQQGIPSIGMNKGQLLSEVEGTAAQAKQNKNDVSINMGGVHLTVSSTAKPEEIAQMAQDLAAKLQRQALEHARSATAGGKERP